MKKFPLYPSKIVLSKRFRPLRRAIRDSVPKPCRLLKKAGENFWFAPLNQSLISAVNRTYATHYLSKGGIVSGDSPPAVSISPQRYYFSKGGTSSDEVSGKSSRLYRPYCRIKLTYPFLTYQITLTPTTPSIALIASMSTSPFTSAIV